MAGRSHYQIVLSDEERQELGHRAACYSQPHRDALRTKLVLYAAEGLSNVRSVGGFQILPEERPARPGFRGYGEFVRKTR